MITGKGIMLFVFLILGWPLFFKHASASSDPTLLEGELSYGKMYSFTIEVNPILNDGFVTRHYTIKTNFIYFRDPIETAFSSIRHLSPQEIVLVVAASLGPSTGTSELRAEFKIEIETSKELKVHVLEGDPLLPTLRLLGSY